MVGNMTNKITNNDDLSQFNSWVPEELLHHLYDTLQTCEKHVMSEMDIYILSQILNEQIRRKLVKTPMNKPSVMFIKDKK